MRATFVLATALLLCLSGSGLANSAPQVRNVSANQRGDDSKLVDIRYDLIDADGDACTVWVVASNDGGATWRVPIVTVWGDVGPGKTPGVNKTIVWDAGADMSGVTGDFRVRVYADDGNSADGLVLIPGGEFKMGDYFSDNASSPNPEKPQHWVFVDAFMMGRYEVTNQQYLEFLNDSLSNGAVEVKTDFVVYKKGTSTPFCATYDATQESRIVYTGTRFLIVPSEKANHPVVHVTWFGAVAYCNWRSQQLGKELCYFTGTLEPIYPFRNGIRLPTEAEWERAARGGLSNKRFPWGDTINHNYANYYANGSAYTYDTSPYTNYTYHPTYTVVDMPYTAPVGSFAANDYQLCDMAGNVWEWCNDWYLNTYYGSSPYYNPTGASTGTYRVLRGGTWINNANYSRVACRYNDTPTTRTQDNGFRVVLDLK